MSSKRRIKLTVSKNQFLNCDFFIIIMIFGPECAMRFQVLTNIYYANYQGEQHGIQKCDASFKRSLQDPQVDLTTTDAIRAPRRCKAFL